jgi:sulfur relay (sulfurtransferase) DsrC/TusE family protein
MYKLKKLNHNEIYKILETKYQMVQMDKHVFLDAIRKWNEELKI